MSAPWEAFYPPPETRTWATAAHWLPLVSHWMGPLVLLLTVGRRNPWVRAEALTSLNWEITVAVGLAFSLVFYQFGVVGPALSVALVLLSVGLHVAGALTAWQGRHFEYAAALPIVR